MTPAASGGTLPAVGQERRRLAPPRVAGPGRAALLCLLLGPVPAPAAEVPFEAARLALRVVSVEDGLPNPRAHAVMRDHLGRLWVGTQEGAAVLGGGGWTAFPLPPEAPSTYVRALAETSDGTVWFGTEAGGLWSHRRGAWRHFAAGRELPVARVNVLHAEGETLWVGTGGGGLLRLRGGAVEAVRGPEDPWIWALASVPDAAGRPRLWVGGEKQIWVLEERGWRRRGPEEGWWAAGANAIASRRGADGRREVWLGGWGHGLGVFDQASGRFVGPVPDSPTRSPTSIAAARLPDGTEELWVGTYDAGLLRLTGRGWQRLGPDQGFPSSGVYALLVDPGGRPRLWAGTRGAGLVAVDPSGWRSLPDLPGLPSRQANCFLETEGKDGSRTFWMGTDRGLVRWDARGISVETRREGLPADFVTDLLELPGPGGPQLWAATHGGVARRRDGRWEAFAEAQGLGLFRVLRLTGDRDENGRTVLFAGAGEGLACFAGDRWRVMTTGTGLPLEIVTSLVAVPDAGGGRSLWVGTRGGGVARLKGGKWRSFGAREGLSHLAVYDLATSAAPSGRRWLWAALLGGGRLARLDLDRPEKGFRSYTQDDLPDLPGQGILRIAVGPGCLYLATPGGVARLELKGPDAEPGRVTAYSASDGLPSSATDTGALYLDREGRVWVGTTKGVAVLDPRSEEEPPLPATPFIERVAVDGRAVDPAAPLRLGFRDRRVAVSYALPVHFRREAIRYRTQLLGLETEPSEWSPRPDRELTTLPPRRYVLRIWARDGLGRVTAPADLALVVAAAPWFTWWAYLLEGLLLAGLVALYVRRRGRELRRRTLELERTVAQRTRELEEANRALHDQSLTDPLTGLSNRRAVDESMDAVVSRLVRRHRGPAPVESDRNRDVAFLIVDLDHFKVVNDTWGHHAGDLVLRQTADLLRGSVREGDQVVRWGGEEFLVVGVETDHDDVPAVAERIRSLFEGHAFEIGGAAPLRKTVSVGFACLPLFPAEPGWLGWEQVLALADQCLYEAKQAGRNRWVGLLPGADPAFVPPGSSAGLDARALVERGWATRREGPGEGAGKP